MERLKNTTRTVYYLGTLLDKLKNSTQNGAISWHTSGGAEEHYKEHRPRIAGCRAGI
jgi:hypothetical protein